LECSSGVATQSYQQRHRTQLRPASAAIQSRKIVSSLTSVLRAHLEPDGRCRPTGAKGSLQSACNGDKDAEEGNGHVEMRDNLDLVRERARAHGMITHQSVGGLVGSMC
jgi:hypothetical protein